MRNAFDVLLSGARRAAKTPGGVQGNYFDCPLCNRTVPSAFANAHLSMCYIKPGAQACPQSRGRDTSVASPSTRPQRHPGDSAAAPEVEDLTGCDDEGENHDGKNSPGRTLPTPQLPGPSAFDIMRQSQLRAASSFQSFFLERTPDGCWLGHYWAKGCSTPAQKRLAASSCWSVTVTVGPGGHGGGGEGASVCLMTNIPPADSGTVSWSSAGLRSNTWLPEGRWCGGQAALKSALQKAVRLGRGSCAVRIALHLLKEEGGASQLLRRLSIVCVEDAILHPGLPLVVWLMAAEAKGFALGMSHVEGLLHIVYQLAMVYVRDGLADPWEGSASFGPGAVQQGPNTLHHVDEFGLPPSEACLVKCLLMRSWYGGTEGDMRMLKGFAVYWAARFRDVAAAPPASPLPSPLDVSSCGGGEMFSFEKQNGGVVVSEYRALKEAPQQGCRSTATGQVPTEAGAAAGGPQTPVGESLNQKIRAAPVVLKGGDLEPRSGSVAAVGVAAVAHGAMDGMAAGSVVVMIQDLPLEVQTPPVGDATATVQEAGSRNTPGHVDVDRMGLSLRSSNPCSLLAGCNQEEAEDAPPSYTAFRPASEWLAEARRDEASVQQVLQQASRSHQEQSSEPPPPPQSSTKEPGTFLLPTWHAHVDVDGDVRRSSWLSYLCELYSQVPLPSTLAHVASVGPLRRGDVPRSAVDFHVSDVVPQLLERPDVRAPAMEVAPRDAEDALKSAMWLFRSNTNPKVLVHSVSLCCQVAGEGGCPEHRGMVAQLARETVRRQQLKALWTAAAPWADQFSVMYIHKRFVPP